MPKAKSEPPPETAMQLLQLAIAAFDREIADLQAKRAQLIALTGPSVSIAAVAPVALETRPKTRTMSDEAKAKISAAAKKRWAKKKKAAKAAQQGNAAINTRPATVKAPAKKAATKTPAKPAAKTKKAAVTKQAQATANAEGQNT
jgi:phosphoribosyl-dephospho-CoA transferase